MEQELILEVILQQDHLLEAIHRHEVHQEATIVLLDLLRVVVEAVLLDDEVEVEVSKFLNLSQKLI